MRKFYIYTLRFLFIIVAFFTIPHLHCLFDHFEYDPPENRYCRERAVYERIKDPGDWAHDFPSFSDWHQEQMRREQAMSDWFNEGVVAAMCTHQEWLDYCAEKEAEKFAYTDGWQKNALDRDNDAQTYEGSRLNSGRERD